MSYLMSFLIPARNEQFLRNTVEDILKNRRGESEVVVGLDGAWASPPLDQHPDVTVVYYPEPIGQRAITNRCANLAMGKYLVKIDAHCSIAPGFDTAMAEAMEKAGSDTTMTAVMRNLHAFDWRCGKCHWQRYQGPTPEVCPQCGERHHLYKKMRWIAKGSPQSTSYCFDATPHFQYDSRYTRTAAYKRDRDETGLTETMSLQGSCFCLTKERYWALDVSQESLGSWGNQGIEVACKSWLSGGRVLVNHKTYYAHMFRTSGGDFGFPYHISGNEVERTKRRTADLFWKKNAYPRQLSWLVERFWPVPGWRDEDLAALKARESAGG